MQVTFFFIYLLFYFLVLWSFLLSLVVCVPLFFFSHVSFAVSFSFLKNYTRWNLLILSFFLLLSGLPPVGLFFIKLNIIVYLLKYWNIFFIILMFLLLFFSMIFYLQVFRFRKGWTNLRILFQGSFYSTNANSRLNQSLNLTTPFKPLLVEGDFYLYNIVYLLFIICFFLFFSIFFITDLYLIFLNIFLITWYL